MAAAGDRSRDSGSVVDDLELQRFGAVPDVVVGIAVAAGCMAARLSP